MKIVIPKETSPYRKLIAAGSGIVMLGKPTACLIYYEGNLYGARNLKSYHQRVECAAGRAFELYPTVACTGVMKEHIDDFVVAGDCHPSAHYQIYLKPEHADLIEAWTGEVWETIK